jgi:hypothetical protein
MTPQSTTWHAFLGRLDGSGGFALVETDNPGDLAETTGRFGFIAHCQGALFPVAGFEPPEKSA